jgi:hypothetical protein
LTHETPRRGNSEFDSILPRRYVDGAFEEAVEVKPAHARLFGHWIFEAKNVS